MKDHPSIDEFGTPAPLKSDDRPAPEAISSNVDPTIPDEVDEDDSTSG